MQFLKIGILALLILRIVASWQRTGSGSYESLAWQGKTFEVQFQRRKKKVENVSLRLAIQDKWRFELRPETRFDRLAKGLGVASEWQTGETGFDERVFILSEDLFLNRALSRDRELRETCVRLLGYRVGARLECKAGMLYYEFPVATGSVDDGLARVGPQFSQELDALAKLRECLQRIRADAWRDERDPALVRKAWLVGISLALGLAGAVALFFDLDVDRHQVVREMIPRLATGITIAVVGLMLIATITWLRSTPHTHAVLLDILLAATPGCWAAANGAVTLYNEKLDWSPPESLPVTVTYTETKKGRSNSYYLVVEQWPDPRAKRKVRISKDEYHWIQQAHCVTVTWHSGRLGDGWVSGYRPGCENELQVEK